MEDMLGVSQHLNIMMMDYLAHHMRPNGKGGSHKKFTGTLELSTGEDMRTDCAESIMDNTHMSPIKNGIFQWMVGFEKVHFPDLKK